MLNCRRWAAISVESGLAVGVGAKSRIEQHHKLDVEYSRAKLEFIDKLHGEVRHGAMNPRTSASRWTTVAKLGTVLALPR